MLLASFHSVNYVLFQNHVMFSIFLHHYVYIHDVLLVGWDPYLSRGNYIRILWTEQNLKRETDYFHQKKLYNGKNVLGFQFFLNKFGFGDPKIKRIRIQRDLDISQCWYTWLYCCHWTYRKVIMKQKGVETFACILQLLARHYMAFY